MPANFEPPPLPVLYEDNHLLVVNKPAGLATQGALPDEPSAVKLAQQYLKQKYAKPGNVFVGVVSRLDEPVSGVLVLARTSKAAARLSEQFRSRTVEKIYWAVVERAPPSPAGKLVDWLIKEERLRRMVVAPSHSPGAAEARLEYRTLKKLPQGAALLEVRLETGRKHQIRVQLATIQTPIWGDRKYGGERSLRSGICLHARLLRLFHPVRREPLEFVAPLPAAWSIFGSLPVDTPPP